MANIKQFSAINLPEDGKLGFRLPQSEPQFNWRNNPSTLQCRQLVKNRIQGYLVQNASGEFTQETSMLATFLESQLFMEALSKNDYMDEVKFYDRLQNIIARRWFEVSSSPQEATYATSSLPRHAFAPTHGMLKSNLSTNFDKPFDNHILTSNAGPAGCNLAFAPNHLAAVPRSTRYGPQDSNLLQSDLVLPNNLSSVARIPNAESADSETTYSGSVLQYDSEASFESHHYKPQGEIDLVMSGDQSSPSVQTPTMAREILKHEAYAVSDDVHMQQPFLGPSQFGQQLFHSESHVGEMKSFGRLTVHSNATLISSNMQQGTATKLLCYYISYSCKKAHEVPFLEYLHLQNCKVEFCSCERYKQLLSHFDSCGSAECSICGPALAICSEKGIIQPGLKIQRNGCKRLVCGDSIGGAESSKYFMNPLKSRKLNSSVRGESSCDVSGLTEEPVSPSGSFSFEHLSVPVGSATIAKFGANVELLYDVFAESIYAVACSPTDAALVATRGRDDRAFLWRINQGDWSKELAGFVGLAIYHFYYLYCFLLC